MGLEAIELGSHRAKMHIKWRAHSHIGAYGGDGGAWGWMGPHCNLASLKTSTFCGASAFQKKLPAYLPQGGGYLAPESQWLMEKTEWQPEVLSCRVQGSPPQQCRVWVAAAPCWRKVTVISLLRQLDKKESGKCSLILAKPTCGVYTYIEENTVNWIARLVDCG